MGQALVSPIGYAKSGDVHVAYRTVGEGPLDPLCDLVAGSGLRFADRGAHTLKGVPGEWRLYSVV